MDGDQIIPCTEGTSGLADTVKGLQALEASSSTHKDTYELEVIDTAEAELGTSPEVEYAPAGVIRESDHEFADIVQRIEKFLQRQDDMASHIYIDDIKRGKANAAAEYALVTMAGASVVVLTAALLVNNIEVLRKLLPAPYNSAAGQEVMLLVMAIATASAVAAGACLAAVRTAERARKNKLLSWLVDDAIHRVNYMSGIDDRILSVYRGIKKGQCDLDRRVSSIEHRECEQGFTKGAVEEMHKDYQSKVSALDASFSTHLGQFNQRIRDIAGELEKLVQSSTSDVKSSLEALQKRVKASELGYRQSYEEAMRCSALNTEVVQSALSSALEQINASCEAMKIHITNTNAQIAAIFKNNVYDARTLVEHVVRRRFENMERVSYMLTNRDAAAAAACVTLYDMCVDMKKVKDLHAARKYEALKKKLVYSGAGNISMMDLFSDYHINETIVMLYEAIAPDLTCISAIIPELKEAIRENKYPEEHGEKCRGVITNCYDKLFAPNGILRKRKYQVMKDKLTTVATLCFPEAQEMEEAVNAIKTCIPSLMIFPNVVQIAENVAKMYESSQSMHAGFSKVQSNLGKTFTFLESQQSVGSNILLTADIERAEAEKGASTAQLP